jgi:hypothetical protein
MQMISQSYQKSLSEYRGVIMLTENEIRQKVQILKQFYLDLISYVVVNVALLFIWSVFDKSGTFWPKYVMVVWGLVLMFKAYRMELFSIFVQNISFLTPEWEDERVEELLERRPMQRKVFLKRDAKK